MAIVKRFVAPQRDDVPAAAGQHLRDHFGNMSCNRDR
jgi:hypothetical protein